MCDMRMLELRMLPAARLRLARLWVSDDPAQKALSNKPVRDAGSLFFLCRGCKDCSRCNTGVDGHPCVTTPVQRQCWYAVGSTVLNPFQVVAKMTVVFWDATAYAWLSYAANSQRASFEVQFNGTNIFAGQPSLAAKLPGFSAPPQQMYYSTSVFGPLDWSLLGPRFSTAAAPRVRICDAAGACTNAQCVFGVDKPVLLPSDVGL